MSKTVRRTVMVVLSLGLAYVVDWAVTDAQGFPPFILTAGVVAAWIVRGASGTSAGLLFGAATLVLVATMLQDLDGVFVVLAALVGSGILAMVVRRWRPAGRVRSPADPLVIGIGAGFVMLLPALAAEVGNYGSLWIVWGAAVLGTLVVLLPAMILGHSAEEGRWLEFSLVATAIVASVLIYVMYSTQDIALGLAAWLLSPILILLSIRYGAGRGSALVSALVLAVPIARILSDNLVPIDDAFARQAVAIFLLLTTNAAVLLLRRDRLSTTELTRNRNAVFAFLNHSEPVWFTKILAPTGDLTYQYLGGGPFRQHKLEPGLNDAKLFGNTAAVETEKLDRIVMSVEQPRVDTETLELFEGPRATFVTNRFPLYGESGKLIGVGGVRTDITKQQDDAQLLAAMFASAPLATIVIEMGDQARVESANRSASDLFGLPVEELVTMPMAALMQPDEWRQLEKSSREILDEDLASNQSRRMELRTAGDLDQRTVVATIGRMDFEGASPGKRVILHLEDVTAQRQAEESMRERLKIDNTTQLWNRQALVIQLNATLHRIGVPDVGTTTPRGLAFVVCDLDGFQKLNDSHGHEVGDRVLAETATRMTATIPEESVLARLGGDEFGIIIPDATQDDAAVLIHRLQYELSRDFTDLGVRTSVLASFGAVIVNETGLGATEVLRRGELALYHAKSDGLGRVSFYADAMRRRAQKILNVREELASAIATNGFSVAYQPIVELDDGRVVAYEALIRLIARDGRLLLPGDFLDIARNEDLVNVIDQSVLKQAVRDINSAKLDQSSAGLHVNCEPEDLRDPNYSMNVLSRLHAVGLDPHRLTVEVTESTLLEVNSVVQNSVAALREAGIQIAIDDFGSGYSGLSQLRQLNPDVLKIDHSFIADLDAKNPQRSIVASIIDLAHELDIKVTAEGIETRDQAEALRKMGCDFGQGYLFGRPELLQEEDPRTETTTPTRKEGEQALRNKWY